jgi:hypothetical protein
MELEMGMVENDNEDDILARAIGDVAVAVTGRRGVRCGGWWAARRLKTVAHEEMLILDLPLSAAAEPVHAALAATKHPLLSGQPATVDDPHRVRWIIADGGTGKLNPVLITVSLTSEAYGTALKIRGAAKEGIIKQRSAQKSVDRLMGLLTDLYHIHDIIDIID